MSFASVGFGLSGLISSVAWWWNAWLFLLAPLVSVTGIALGDTARRRDRSIARRPVAITGLVLGSFGLALWILWLVLFVWLASDSGVSL